MFFFFHLTTTPFCDENSDTCCDIFFLYMHKMRYLFKNLRYCTQVHIALFYNTFLEITATHLQQKEKKQN